MALGLAAVLAGALAVPPLAAQAQGEECIEQAFWVQRVDGAAALSLRALQLSDRLRGASPLRHRASQRLRLVRCPSDSDAPVTTLPPGTRGSGLSAFANARLTANSGYPRGGNDGALWQGRGLAGLLRPGVAVGWRFFTASLAPEAVAWQNAEFRHRGEDLEALTAFRNFWHPRMDLPDRPGADAEVMALPGQSFVRLDLGPLTAGLSTANFRYGAAHLFPLLASAAGPGFPHAFLGTSGPLHLGPVSLEVEVFAGEVEESDFYDEDPSNDRRALMGTYLGLGLDPVGLWIGALRIYSEYLGPDRTLEQIFRENLIDLPIVEGDRNLPGNGLASALVRWAPPGTGFELYGEYGREDYAYNFEDIIREPDWTRAYNIGASKLFEARKPILVNIELANLSPSNPERAGKGWFTWYTHSVIAHGHTQRGQPLGAWIGPGSTAQRLSVDIFDRAISGGYVGGYLQRVAYDEDAFYRNWSRLYGAAGHDIELTAGAHALRHALGGTVMAGIALSHRRNRGFVVFDNEGSTSSEWNVALDLRVLY